MTITTTINRVNTVGDGSVTAFSFPYLFFSDDDLKVILVTTATGVEVVKVKTTHYTVTGAGVTAGGVVNMGTPPASTETLVIIREEQFTQTLDLVENDPFPSAQVEQQLDTLTMLTQQINTEVQRSVKLPDGDSSGADTTLSTPIANAYLLWDAAGTALTTSTTSVGQSLGGNGTVSLPFYSYSADPDSGHYRIGANNLGLALGGAKIVDYGAATTTFASAVTSSGVITGTTIEATGDTSAGDNSALGYTSALGAIVTGQGSTNDITLVNDADATVLAIPTGTTNVDIVGVATAATFEPDGDTSAADNAAIGYDSANGIVVTGQGSSNDVVLKNDADAIALEVPTGTQNVNMLGNLVLTGNLTVNGSTVTNDATNTTIKDPLIELNTGASSNANDLGLIMERGSTGNNVFMGWDESGDYFGFGTTTATGASTGNITYSLAQARFAGLNLSGTSADLGAVTTIDINGGTVDGAVVGGAAAAAGTFTDLASTGDTTVGNATGDAFTINPAAWTLANAVTVTGTWANLGAVTTADINGGTVDGAVIGGASAAAITGTTLTAGTSITLATGGAMTGVLDSDTMSGASTALLSTSESIKAYVDNNAPENGVKFAFESTTTDTDQGAGKVWLNNGTPSSASVLYVDDVEAGGVSVNAWVDTWDDVSNSAARGYIYIASYGTTNAILVYKVTGSVTSASTYSKIACSHVLTVGTISDGDSIGLTFVPSGADGAGSGDMEASNNLSDVASAATSFGNIKQAASTSATGVVEIATDAETNTGSATNRVITPANLTQRAMLQGLHSMWIPAGSMIPQITNGPSSGLFESSSNDIMSRTLDFNTSTDELAQFTVVMPKSWNEGTVTFRAYWTAASGSGTVLWSYAGGSFADSLALDTALGSEAVTAADTLLTALDVHVSAISAACTIANSPAAGGLVIIRVRRDVSGDNLGVDAKLLGVQMFYTADAGNDA